MPRAWAPYPTEEPPGYNPDDPYADKIALIDHRHYQLGQYFILEARARVRYTDRATLAGVQARLACKWRWLTLACRDHMHSSMQECHTIPD